MTDDLTDVLRCPIDPTRTARLERDQQALVCDRCRARFPVKRGVPILLAEDADLPDGTRDLAALPCRRTPGNRRSRSQLS